MSQHTYRLVITYNNAGQFAQNVLHYQFDDALFPDTQAAALALINAWDATARPKLQLMIPTSVTILSLKARAVTQVGGFEAIKLLAAGITGARTGAMQASGLGPLIKLLPLNSTTRTGKIFLPGITISDATDGVLTTAFSTILETNAGLMLQNLILTGGGGPTATIVVFGNQPAGAALPVQHIIASNNIATQRNRQRPV